MGELGIERPDDVPTMEGLKIEWFRFLSDLEGRERTGTSTLKKWCCPECGLKVRMGIASDPMLRHHSFETTAGRPVFLVPGDIYVAKK
jgi:hypothetical protein